MQKATFAAGCFWGVEEIFRKLKGVKQTRVGYTGGKWTKPTYMKVCTGLSGHAESIEITFNQKMVSYKRLLEKFWSMHNPTQGNRQGFNLGPQYRSAIFYHSKEQKKQAEESRDKLQKKLEKKITTQIKPVQTFYEAEKYHQKYIQKKSINT
ncbi:peptide-methionine (S)-S-oxide reductase MsrA [Candidatus Woesearchaeota archaeon]|nr:peptide-methionine (S)-S-oxide reductase MsrA [Candidatus Woesearchaeota archaeon]